MNIFIETKTKPIEEQMVEFVETKGLGHPDTICDSVCEHCADALAEFYKKRFGKVLHYNIDKALLIAGASIPRFGGGKTLSPVRLIIAGRATNKVHGKEFNAAKVIKASAESYLSRFKGAKFNVIVDVKPGAANLRVIAKDKVPVANDTSFGASHYPFSKTESMVSKARDYILSPEFRRRYPSAGQDIKVMGIRVQDKIRLVVAIAFIGKHVRDMEQYIKIKNSIITELTNRYKVNVDLNTLDDVTGDENLIYLTVTGLSAEMGDDGQVGRGNRYNGLITPSRPMSLEACAGKNARHPGRSYQVAAFHAAKSLVKAGAKSAEVKIITNIGGPLEEPSAVSLKLEGQLSKPVIEKCVRDAIKAAIK
jgi:S-adenosylmethionine synthetase